ncbi:MAG TPA: DMT family transporter [Burkholderiales bacterium]|nr:DMT family transporter [Burkholderiales bacterium]
MEAKLSPGTAIVILLGVASAFASNHLCARIAFDHGAAVATGVSVRATFTALFLFFVMRVQGVKIAIPRELRGATLLAGVLIATQSYTLYSAVAIIPPALALLVFQTSPMLYVLLTWALGKEKPRWSALPPMILALVGLALALNVRGGDHMVAGVAWAFASGLSMTVVYYLNANALKALDGRLRTFAMTAVTAVLVVVLASAAGAQALPREAAGWAGLALLAVFYCIAMMVLFYVLPRVPATSTGALNFEPIALLVLTWIFLGHTLSALQVLGAFVTVGAIAWLGVSRK